MGPRDESVYAFQNTAALVDGDGLRTPAALYFSTPAPNITADGTTLHYRLPSAVAVSLDVFDVRGRRVRNLVKEQHAAGDHTVHWDGSDETSARVASGHYFFRLQVRSASGSFVETQKGVITQ